MPDSGFGLLDDGRADRSRQDIEIRETVTCELCGPQFERPFRTVAGHYAPDEFHTCRCTSCGLVFVNPRLRSEFRSFCYEHETHLIDHFLGRVPHSRRAAEHQLDVLARRGCSEGTILDIGCGVGILLDVAKERGFSTVGIELNRGCAEYTGKRHDVRRVDFLEAELQAESFDAIVMDQVLEHLGAPRRALEKVAMALRPGGWLVLGVPAYDWLRLGLDDIRAVLRSRRTLWSPEDHLYYFTPGCLIEHLASVGLSAEETRSGSLRSQVSSMLRASSGGFVAFKAPQL